MLNTSNVRVGNVIRNHNGHKYDVLATRKNFRGQQDLLLKDKKTKNVVIAKYWDCDDHKNERIGSWGQGEYYGNLSPYQLNRLKKKFKKKRGK